MAYRDPSRPLRTLLIDADILAYSAAASNQTIVQWDEGAEPSVATDRDAAERQIADAIDKLMADLNADDYLLCLSDDFQNFRKDVWAQYKGNRKTVERPVMLYDLKEWMADNFPHDRRRKLEADDVMGILATEPGSGEDRIIVSADKDMQTIPGLLYRPQEGKVRWIDPEEADRFHLMQTLMGDATDGYPGCPGVGPDKASSALDERYGWAPHEHIFRAGPRKGTSETRWEKVDMDDPWKIVVSHFYKAGLTAHDALVQARLARILRWTDFDGKRPILWKPGA